ncbi:uncharacterized protein LOC129756709 [Uranotaenia lowii]|uniref:uncharacterized protein LOC129756709 n=1 Tax=Uranotaenia lowii TaxID=190385 RepID=UPI002479E333|nr:uncharacterized protein LOC129756709 [Uranotaenia lowii]
MTKFIYRLLIFGVVFMLGLSTIQGQDVQDCGQILKFVKEYGAFLTIVPRETYPVSKICSNETVYKHYTIANENYQNATQDKLCIDQLQNNRMNWIKLLHDQMSFIWQSANCQDCVDHRNETDQFFKHWEELDQCMEENKQNQTALCIACNGNYSIVQDYYEGLPSVKHRQVCFDIEDRMNQTRRDWSAKYGCCKDKQHSQTAFILYAAGICSLPVMFYAVMCIVTLRKRSRDLTTNPPLLDDSNVSNESQSEVTGAEPMPGPSQTNGEVVGIAKSTSEIKEVNWNILDKPGPREDKLLDLTTDTDSLPVTKSIAFDDDEEDESLLDTIPQKKKSEDLLA